MTQREDPAESQRCCWNRPYGAGPARTSTLSSLTQKRPRWGKQRERIYVYKPPHGSSCQKLQFYRRSAAQSIIFYTYLETGQINFTQAHLATIVFLLNYYYNILIQFNFKRVQDKTTMENVDDALCVVRSNTVLTSVIVDAGLIRYF